MPGRTTLVRAGGAVAIGAVLLVAVVGGGSEHLRRDASTLRAAPTHAAASLLPTPSPRPIRTVAPVALAWPATGQASVEVGGVAGSSPGQRPVPIASVAKIMTAYVVLRRIGAVGSITVTGSDVADTAYRRAHNQSVVAVEVGEVLTERQALDALLVPSANNVAVMVAAQVAGSQAAFVALMNATARSLGMASTTYTDPSGYDAGTVSTAADQLRLVEAAMALPTFAAVVGQSTATVPVAGVVRNNDALLGVDGFTGVKTGSSYSAHGCFAFRSTRPSGRVVAGVVLDQPGSGPAAFIVAGLAAGRALADQVR